MAQKKITIRTIAEHCGVSVSTVSLVINNKPGIRPGVRELVLKTIEELGWRSNSLGGRFGNVTEVVLVGNPWLLSNFGGHPTQLTMARLIEKFEERGIISSTYYGRNLEVMRNCLERRPMAVVVFSSNFLLRDAIEKLCAAGIRVVIAHAEWSEAICPRVHSDHVNAGRLAGRKLREAGCEHPAFFGGLGLRVHCTEWEELGSPVAEYLTGLTEEFPAFDFHRDMVGDAFGDVAEVAHMLQYGEYDGWIFQLRQFFNRFAFLRERLEKECVLPGIRRMITFDTAIQPSFPLSRYGCLAENSEKIAELVFQLVTASKTPEPMEYAIPYLWRADEGDYTTISSGADAAGAALLA